MKTEHIKPKYAAHGEPGTEAWIEVYAESCAEAEKRHKVYAHAPELLDVAQKALIWFEAFQPSFPPSTAVGSTIEGTVEILRAAIAKATK